MSHCLHILVPYVFGLTRSSIPYEKTGVYYTRKGVVLNGGQHLRHGSLIKENNK